MPCAATQSSTSFGCSHACACSDEPLALGVAADLLEPVGRARADGVRGDADADPARAQPLDLVEVRSDGFLRERLDRVRGVEEHELDPRFGGRLRGSEGGVEAEVVELADRRVAAVQHLL